MYAIYALLNPLKKEVFYVGMTADVSERYIQHFRGKDDTNIAKNEVIQGLRESGIFPVMVTINQAETREEALQKEAYAIELFRALHQPLVNQHLKIGYTFDEVEQQVLQQAIKLGNKQIAASFWRRLLWWIIGGNAYSVKINLHFQYGNCEMQYTVLKPLWGKEAL